MNNKLERLNPYPFERLRQLLKNTPLKEGVKVINLLIGEPMHEVPSFVEETLAHEWKKLAKYPATLGTNDFRFACASWLKNRYDVELDADKEILSVNGTREALFSFVQATLDLSKHLKPIVVVPNPFYQIYEGATLLAGGELAYANTIAPHFLPAWDQITHEEWKRTQIVFVCSPGNPTGSVMKLSDWEYLFKLQSQYGFIIASDECYSEIYFDQKPLSVLESAKKLGLNYDNKVMFTSLSKRSNLPGLRSGFVAGDRELLSSFLLYRTYHGSAMSELVQQISIKAWSDEIHVEQNRQLYRAKFSQVVPILQKKYDIQIPEASFYLWLRIPSGDDVEFAKRALEKHSVRVLPGSLLAKDTFYGNPGKGYVRIALVAPLDKCLEAAHRLIQL